MDQVVVVREAGSLDVAHLVVNPGERAIAHPFGDVRRLPGTPAYGRRSGHMILGSWAGRTEVRGDGSRRVPSWWLRQVEGVRQCIELDAVLLVEEAAPGLRTLRDLMPLVAGRDPVGAVWVEGAVEIQQQEWAHYSTLGFVGGGP
jgi:hypothetical protein